MPDPSAAVLLAVLHRVAPLIAEADAVGEREDVGDLYHLIDGLTDVVGRVLPDVPCLTGCSHCCNAHVFRVTFREYLAVRRQLLAWEPEARRAVLDANQRQYGPFRPALEAIATHWSRGEKAPVPLYHGLPGRCPLLDHAGRCGVYPGRPAICRAYGFFTARVEEEAPSMLMCRQLGPAWVAKLEALDVGHLPMPNWSPVQRRLEALSEGLPIMPLPLWLLEDDEDLRAL